MGAFKRAIEPIYELLEQEFEEQNGRSPTDEEASKLWDQAVEKFQGQHEAKADAARKGEA